MKIRELMTTDVVTVTPKTSLKEAAGLLVKHGISGVPVVDDGAVVGVFSEADVLLKEGREGRHEGLLGWLFESDSALEHKLEAKTVGEAMTTPPITIGPDVPVHKAASRMVDDAINRLPVVEPDGKLVGIVTRADLVRAFTRSDEDIANEIRNEILRRTLWLDPGTVTVRVADGEVRLAGEVETETDAELLPVFVARIPGVVSVQTSLGIRQNAHAG
jgi:CBS domain-containing protein